MEQNTNMNFQANERINESKNTDEKRFEFLLNLFVKHQEQFQQVFSIVTAIGLGWLAAVCVLLSIDIEMPKWVIPCICGWGALNIILELIGILLFKNKIEKEEKTIVYLFDHIYPNGENRDYFDFFSMPNSIIRISIFLICVEGIAFIALTSFSVLK